LDIGLLWTRDNARNKAEAQSDAPACFKMIVFIEATFYGRHINAAQEKSGQYEEAVDEGDVAADLYCAGA
jgi:hypothetical protein